MTRLTLDEKTLALELYSENPNAAEVSRIMSERLGRIVYPKSVLRTYRKDNFIPCNWGKPPRANDEIISEYFEKYKNLGVLEAAKLATEEIGYKTYLTVKRRWFGMGLI